MQHYDALPESHHSEIDLKDTQSPTGYDLEGETDSFAQDALMPEYLSVGPEPTFSLPVRNLRFPVRSCRGLRAACPQRPVR